MFTYRKSEKEILSGPVITQPDQSFTVRQIIDQFARGEIIPTIYESTDTLSDDIDDDDMDSIIEFEDRIDAEAHLIANHYELLPEDDHVDTGKEQKGTPDPGEGHKTSPAGSIG